MIDRSRFLPFQSSQDGAVPVQIGLRVWVSQGGAQAQGVTPQKTNMTGNSTMNQDVFPIENGD